MLSLSPTSATSHPVAGNDSAAPLQTAEPTPGRKRPPSCQVPGCTADLTKLKSFNMRCKICDVHRTLDAISIDGEDQRFCQQCNRFHPLSAFDKHKRGCREKLSKHNKRRQSRGPAAGSSGAPKKAKGSDFSAENMTKVLAGMIEMVARSQGTAGGASTLDGAEGWDAAGLKSVSSPRSSSGSHADASNAQPSLNSAGPHPEACSSEGRQQKHLKFARMSNPDSGASAWTMASAGLNDLFPVEGVLDTTVRTDSVTQDVPSETPVRHILKSEAFSALPAGEQMSFSSKCQLGPFDLELPPVASAPMGDFSISSQYPKLNAAISPAPAAQGVGQGGMFDSTPFDDAFIWRSASDGVPPVSSRFSAPGRQDGCTASDMSKGGRSADSHFCIGPGCCICAMPSLPSTTTASHDTCTASDSFVFGNTSMYPSEISNTRMSMKVQGATPWDLPGNLHGMMCDTMGVKRDSGALTGYIRPGCVFLTVDAVMDSASHAGSVIKNLPSHIHSMLQSGPLASQNIDVQVGGTLLGFEAGELISHSPLPADTPVVNSVTFAAADDIIQAVVTNYAAHSTTVLLRMDGHYVPCEIERAEPLGGGRDLLTISCRDRGLLGVGWLELMDNRHGPSLLSEDIPILLTNNAQVAGEICSISSMAQKPPKAEVASLLWDIDRILHGDTDESSLDLCAKVAQVVCSQGWDSTFLATINCALKHAPLSTLVDLYGQQWLKEAVSSGMFKLVAQVVYCFATAKRVPDLVNKPGDDEASILDHAVARGDSEILCLLYTLIAASQSSSLPQEWDKPQDDVQYSRVRRAANSELEGCEDMCSEMPAVETLQPLWMASSSRGQLNSLCFAALSLRLAAYVLHGFWCQGTSFLDWRLQAAMATSLVSVGVHQSCLYKRWELHRISLLALQLLAWLFHYLLMWDASGGFSVQLPPYSWSMSVHLIHGSLAYGSAAISNVCFFSDHHFQNAVAPFGCTWLYYLGAAVLHSQGAMALWKESLAALIPSIASTAGLLVSCPVALRFNPPSAKLKQKLQ